MRFPLVLLALSALPLAGANASPGDTIGATVKIVNLVTAEFNRDTRSLQAGDNVRQDEEIEVDKDALGELAFRDETKLALGPGSRLKLDKFVYDADKTGSSIIVNLVKGTFRFMTGVADKPAYVIKTPSASITVRGTIFDTYVEESGRTWVLLSEGALTACNARGKCRDIDKPGELLLISDDGDVGAPVRWASFKEGPPFESAFPFVVTPPSIDPKPILTREAVLEDEPAEKPKEPKRSGTKKTEGKQKADTPKKKTTSREEKPKKTRKASNADTKAVMDGVGIAIGIGGGLKFGGGKSRSGGMKPDGGMRGNR